MKKTFNILFALLLLLTGCHSAPAAEQPAAAPQPTISVTVMEVQAYTAAPTDLPLPDLTPAPVPEEDDGAAEERIVGHCISILDALPYRADLTGDGQTETVDLVALPGETDGQPRWTVSVQKGQETKLFQTDVPEDMPCDLFAGDLDENGQYELFFHGDLASSDYLIYAFRSDLSVLLGNLLENAVEATARQKEGEKRISVKGGLQSNGLFAFTVDNTCAEPPRQTASGELRSSKHSGLGIGTASIRDIASRYGGIVHLNYSEGLFEASVLLYL